MGPILVVPYKYTQTTWKDQVINGRSERLEVTESLAGRAFFLPHSFKVEAKLDPDRLHRGIYEAVVYRATLRLSGDFAKPVIEDSTESAQQMRWDEAEIALAISDLRGAKQALVLKIGESSLTLEPGSRLEDSTARWRMADVVQR
jgi:inner membrane protein